MKTRQRYCKSCASYELQDRVAKDEDDRDIVSRCLFGFVTAGISELLVEYVWKCQRCGVETKV